MRSVADRCGGPVISESGYAALRLSDEPYLLDPAKLGWARELGLPGSDDILRKIRRGEFGLVVTIAPAEGPAPVLNRPFPADWLLAIQRRYELASEWGVPGRPGQCYFYVPRTGADEAGAD
jgi:hypothetical protein